MARAALLILAKDLRQRVRDRSAWILGVVAPLAIAGVLGLVVGGFARGELPPPRWAVVDLDGGEVAASLVGEVLPSAGEALGADVTPLASRQAGIDALGADEVDAVFVLPAGLSAAVASPGTVPDVEVLGAIGSPVQHTVALAIADQWSREVDVRRGAVLAAVAAGVDPTSLDPSDLAAPDLVTTTSLGSQDRTLDGSTHIAAGMAVFFLFFTVQLGVVGLLEERTGGTLARLRAAPIPGGAIVAGKILTSIVIGWLATVLLVGASTWMLGASWGPTIPVLLLVTAAVLAAVSLVTVVVTFAESADAANNAQAVIGIVLGMLGGAFFPIATQPGLLATLSDLTPHGMFLTAVGDLSVPGAGVSDILPQLLGLLGFGAAVAAGASGLSRLREVA